jgi:hypothetical protein
MVAGSELMGSSGESRVSAEFDLGSFLHLTLPWLSKQVWCLLELQGLSFGTSLMGDGETGALTTFMPSRRMELYILSQLSEA